MSGIFFSEIIYFKMKQESKKHNVEYLKRLAKTIKKQQNTTHHQSLDTVAKIIGFNNWKIFLENAKDNSKKDSSKESISIKTLSEAEKVNPYRNLLVAAVNHLVNNKYISLNPINPNPEQENGHVFLNLFGQPSVVLWSNRGFDELLISVWWKYDHINHPQANLEGNSKENFNLSSPLAKKQHYKKFVGVVASCWLERRTGTYLQGKNQDYISNIYTRRGELENLKKMPIQKPKGYKTSGLFHF